MKKIKKMKNENLIPLFGLFQDEDLSILKKFISDIWGIEPKGMGCPMSHEIFTDLPFRKEITVPAMVIGTRFLGNDHPDYNKIKNARNCKVILVLQEGHLKEQWYSPSNWPDYFFDPSKGVLTKACILLDNYEEIQPEKVN